MAGDWLKVEASIWEKPEVWQMSQDLDLDLDAVVGKLLRIWSWFDQQTINGNAPSVTVSFLDARVGVTGFCDAMKVVGWMREKGGQVLLPNFDRHNGQTAKDRALTAKRQQHYRSRKSNGRVTVGTSPEKRSKENSINKNTPLYPPTVKSNETSRKLSTAERAKQAEDRVTNQWLESDT